ncbi:MAG: pyridoxal-phosphate dependent enzyme [Bacteroidales bacterium]
MSNSKPIPVPTRQTILQVHQTIKPFIHQTPILTSSTFNKMLDAEIFFKCENLQKGGAFKFRGATSAVRGLTAHEAAQGVATHSSGNHAQALSLAARMRGIPAHIVMPENAPRIKVDAVKDYGGQITFCMPTLQARESTLQEVIERTGALEIHPYNDYRIIAGQATAAAEVFEQHLAPDYIIAPVGGGGLLSGTILSTRYFSPSTRVIGAEPLMANDAWKCFQQKKFIPSENPQTIADGLRTSLGSLTYPIIMEGVHDILTVSEQTIIQAMYLIWERMKIVVEPSGAVPLAVMMEHDTLFRGKKVALILSGGNSDLNNLPWMENRSFNKH